MHELDVLGCNTEYTGYSQNVCCCTVKFEPIEATSLAMFPATLPEPYEMVVEDEVAWTDDDAEAS